MLCAALSGCFAPPPAGDEIPGTLIPVDVKSLTAPDGRVHVEGFSVIPPGGWQASHRTLACSGPPWYDDCDLSFYIPAGGAYMAHAFLVPAQIEPRGTVGVCLKTGLATCIPGWEQARNQDHFKEGWSLIAREVTAEKKSGAECYRYKETDQRTIGSTEQTTVGYLCAHPARPDYTVLVECSQAFAKADGPSKEIAARCGAFVDSLATEPLK